MGDARPASDLWVDVEAFEALSGSSEPEDLRAGLALYRGELLAEHRYDEWYMARRDALARVRNGMLGQLAQHCLEVGELTEARGLLERLLEVDPADEGAHQALMRVHATSGDGAAAQQKFAALLGALRDTLDVEPSAESHRSVRVGGARAPGAELVRRAGRGGPGAHVAAGHGRAAYLLLSTARRSAPWRASRRA